MLATPLTILIEFLVGVFTWWIAVYLLSQNPYHRMVRLIFGLFASISIYFTTDFFFYSAINTHHYYLIGIILRAMSWAIYLPIAFLYHISFGNKISLRQKTYITISYFIAGVSILLETATSLTRNYQFIAGPNFKGDLATATGPLFWLSGTFIIAVSLLCLINLWTQIKTAERNTVERKRLLIAFWGILISFSMSPFIIMGYYNIIPHAAILSSISFLIMTVPLFYSIVKYNLFIDDTKIVFGKNFLFSTVSMIFILLVFLIAVFTSGIEFQSTQSFLLPFLLIYLLITSHTVYNWFSTFSQDIIYNLQSGLSVVNDQEVYSALREYRNPEKLEDSTLLRLKWINNESRKNKIMSVDALRLLIKESVGYFEPKTEPYRRIKPNLKYHLLKMLVFDQAEEGQILWELGFDEYPVKILSNERRYRTPLFKIDSPADYTYASRNAFLALKKEAIHDITWRISYLEKKHK